MTLWAVTLAVVALGAALVMVLGARAAREVPGTVHAFDDLRRDVRLAVVEVRAEHEQLARRRAALQRRSADQGRG